MIYPRPDLEDFVTYLADKYPKCFVVDPRMRRPLKRDIITDLQKEKVLDDDRVAAAVSFYTRNWTYQKCAIQAGLERVDLNGNKAGIVTELEQRTAQKRVQVEKQEISERNGEGLPAVVVNKLSKGIAPMKKPPAEKPPTDPTQRLQVLIAGLRDIDTEDEGLRTALTAAALGVIVTEAQKLIDNLGRSPCS
jgi:sRNA-binding protein